MRSGWIFAQGLTAQKRQERTGGMSQKSLLKQKILLYIMKRLFCVRISRMHVVKYLISKSCMCVLLNRCKYIQRFSKKYILIYSVLEIHNLKTKPWPDRTPLINHSGVTGEYVSHFSHFGPLCLQSSPLKLLLPAITNDELYYSWARSRTNWS